MGLCPGWAEPPPWVNCAAEVHCLACALMHRSRLAGFIIDCKTDDLDAATRFWAQALGMKPLEGGLEGYLRLDSESRGLTIEVQRVSHESRLHLDIETDDVEAEVARLEKLGAHRVAKVKTWWVMQAPSGQRFCVIQGKEDLDKSAGLTVWE
jgi:catechol 2,3-dioxygenase-like lactoylglutathione lyase family enzyme